MSSVRTRHARLAILVLFLGVSPDRLLAWGQPEHAVIGETMLRRYSGEVPGELSASATRDAYVYGCYGPDGYLFHGPEYVHLDRHFGLLLLQNARDSRTMAFAYGWASHQEQDVSGHGRYIRESGLTHLKKEITLGTRIRYQGEGYERDVIKGMKAIFDVDQIHTSSVQYAERFGAHNQVVSRRHAELAGLGYGAYLTALKGILWASWYGYLKWKPSVFPRSEWQRTFEESVVYTRDWCKDPQSFSGSASEALRVGLFDRFSAEAFSPRAEPRTTELTERDPAAAAHRVRNAVQELITGDGGPVAGIRTSRPGLVARTVYPASHGMLRDDQLVSLGAELANSSGIRMEEKTDGSFWSVEPVVVDAKAMGRDLLRILKDRGDMGIFSAGHPEGERDEFFTNLEAYTERALEQGSESDLDE